VRWDPAAYDDLKAETRRARQLTHPHIVRIHDFVEDASGAAISMELVDGRTLTELRLEQPQKIFEPADIAPWLPQLCAALDYAHTQARVVHRDLKPSNLMLTRDGTLKVADFGVARNLADSISRVSLMSAGTLVYMSPQQAMGEEPAPADDIYALGATLYELLTGKPPFHTGDVRVQLFQRKPDSLAARRKALGIVNPAHIPPKWEHTIAACLAKEPEKRPATASEIPVRLGAADPAPVKQSPAARTWERASSLLRSFRLRPGLPMLVALLVLTPVAVWLNWPRPTRPPWIKFPSDETRALAAWNFDGDARDGSGRGFDGQSSFVVPAADRFGRIDRALHFNGNAEVVVPDAPALRWGGAQAFTAALWARNTEGGHTNGMVWNSAGDTVGALGWALGFGDGRAAARLGRNNDGTYEEQIQLSGRQVLPAGEWHHLAIVSDGTTFTLYVDGSPQAARALGSNRAAPAPRHTELRFGRPFRLSSWTFAGDLDEARLWRRGLAAAEVAALARREPPPRFALSRTTLTDNDDFEAVLRTEFGPDARLADWQDLKRTHADDARSWGDETGLRVGELAVWLQRDGQRRFDEKRHFLLARFDSVKPDYFLAHDEFGGAAFLLGSWYGSQCRLLAALPASTPRQETLLPDASGAVRWRHVDRDATGLALSWRMALAPDPGRTMAVTLRLRDGRELRVVCRPEGGETMSLAVTDHARQVPAHYGECEFTLVARTGALRFRAVTAVGGSPVFAEETAVAGFTPADLTALELTTGAQSGLAAARLTVE
jgi:hypothetical protein